MSIREYINLVEKLNKHCGCEESVEGSSPPSPQRKARDHLRQHMPEIDDDTAGDEHARRRVRSELAKMPLE